MEQSNSTKHSIKVPQLYKDASKVLKRYDNKEGSLKTLVYSSNHRRGSYTTLFGLLSNLIDNITVVKSAIEASQLLADNPKFDPYLAQVFTGHLLVKGAVKGDCKPIQVFNEYESKIKAFVEGNYEENVNKSKKVRLPRYVRINTLVGSVSRVHAQLESDGFIIQQYDETASYDDFLELVENLYAPYYLMDYHIPDLLVFPPGTSFWDNILYKDNVIILQDKASCLPVFLSDVSEDCHVIDACAAPGNKTCHIAARMRNRGKIFAVEYHQRRFHILKKYTGDRKATCVRHLSNNFAHLVPEDYSNVEYIFVDPTCSSSGTDVHQDEVSTERIAKLSSLQISLLSHALSFPSVKEVVYSTCSTYEEENEDVVSDVMMKYGHSFTLADLGLKLEGWKHFGQGPSETRKKCLRTNKEIDRCTGFFVAKFVRKNNEGDSAERKDHTVVETQSEDVNKNPKRTLEDVELSEENVGTKKKSKSDCIEREEDKENGDETMVEVQSEETDAIDKKKKKKKSKSDCIETEKAEENMVDETVVEIQSEETDAIDKKKKKKKSKSDCIETEKAEENMVDETVVEIQSEETDAIDKKKKKSKSDCIETEKAEENMVDETVVEIQSEETDEKNKKKKKSKSKKK